MDITPHVGEGLVLVESYGISGFRISGHRYRCPFVATERVVEWQRSCPLVVRDFASLEGLEDLEVLLIGMGKRSSFLSEELERYFRLLPLPVEAMSTASACSSYNVLAIEGRRVGAVLQPL